MADGALFSGRTERRLLCLDAQVAKNEALCAKDVPCICVLSEMLRSQLATHNAIALTFSASFPTPMLMLSNALTT
jgi:hypothetical protein